MYRWCWLVCVAHILRIWVVCTNLRGVWVHYLAPITMSTFSTLLINALLHYPLFPNTGVCKAVNNGLLDILQFGSGEGWHKNHHRHGHHANVGELWYEVDVVYRIIQLLECVGLVEIVMERTSNPCRTSPWSFWKVSKNVTTVDVPM